MKTLGGFILGLVLILGTVLLIRPSTTAQGQPPGETGAINDLQSRVQAFEAAQIPVGTVVPFAGPASNVPNGWLLCDGAEVDRTTFADLFGVIGTSHGEGDGATTFNLPDYRGRFLRGVDSGQGRDPDATSRGRMNPGGSTGDSVGSVQLFASARPVGVPFATAVDPSHTHLALRLELQRQRRRIAVGRPGVRLPRRSWPFGFITRREDTSVAGGHAHFVDGGGDSETRPVNAYVNWIIKT